MSTQGQLLKEKMANASVTKVDDHCWTSVKNKVQDWTEKTGAMVLVLYVPRPTKRNPVPTLKFEGSNKLKGIVESSHIREVLLKTCASSCDELAPKKTLKEAMENVTIKAWTMQAKRFIISGLVRQYMELRYGLKRDIWGYPSLQPEWWPVGVPYISPNERRTVDRPLSNEYMDEVLESYVKWKSEADPTPVDHTVANLSCPDPVSDGLDTGKSTQGGLMEAPVTGEPVMIEPTVDVSMTDSSVIGESIYEDVACTSVTETSVTVESTTEGVVDDTITETRESTYEDVVGTTVTETCESTYEDHECMDIPVQSSECDTSGLWSSDKLDKYIKMIWGLPNYKEATQRNIILSKTHGMKVSTKSLHAMKSCVPDEIIDTYLSILCTQFSINKEYKHVPCAVSTMIFNSRLQHRAGDILDGPEKCKYVAVINRKSIHWVLVVIDIASNQLLIIDPLGETAATCNNLLQLWKSYLAIHGHDGVWTVVTPPHSKQLDSNSCGVFCMKFAEAVICGGTLHISTDRLQDYRSEIFRTIIHNQDHDTRNLCRYCGQKNPICRKGADAAKRVRWIGCDACEIFWVHLKCCPKSIRGRGLFLCDICA